MSDLTITKKEMLLAPCTSECSKEFLYCLAATTGLTLFSGLILAISGLAKDNPPLLITGCISLMTPAALICLKLTCIARGTLQDRVRGNYHSL